MSIAKPFRKGRVHWRLLPAVVALALFALAWQANRGPSSRAWNPATSTAATWPHIIPFNLPGVVGPHFYDFQVVLWAADREAAGFDCYDPPNDGSPFYFNYPKGWTLLRFLGIGLAQTHSAGLLFLALFFVAVISLPGLSNPWAATWIALSLLSESALAGISWLNNDLLIFPLLVAAVWAARSRPTLAAGVLTAAAVLKLVPAATFPALLNGTRQRRMLVVGATGLVIVLFALNAPQLAHAARVTPKPHARAFGHQVLAARALDLANRHPAVMKFYESSGGYASWNLLAHLVAAAGCMIVIASAILAGLRRGKTSPPSLEFGPLNIAFRVGALMYLGSFAVGYNFNHRLVFLLLAAPSLCITPGRRWIALLALGIMWSSGIPTGVVYLATQVGTWILAAALAYHLTIDLHSDATALLPRWVGQGWPVRAGVGKAVIA